MSRHIIATQQKFQFQYCVDTKIVSALLGVIVSSIRLEESDCPKLRKSFEIQ